MGDVAKLVPKPVKCNQGVKRTLIDVLKMARKENLAGIAIAAVDIEGRVWTSFVPGDNRTLLLGALARLERRVMDEAEE